ncbi:phosphotransferase [Bifidobacterium pseudolongum]|uniref:phosphotransferase n=1 Tax=Bifidobacterium pseudolongum TaxID=1694 RepID=UPI003530991D
MAYDALLHGDYYLLNIILDNWRFSGFIDLDHADLSDRHIDVFWGAWTLWFILRTDAYRNRFLDAYGRNVIDGGKLAAIAAMECFCSTCTLIYTLHLGRSNCSSQLYFR